MADYKDIVGSKVTVVATNFGGVLELCSLISVLMKSEQKQQSI